MVVPCHVKDGVPGTPTILSVKRYEKDGVPGTPSILVVPCHEKDGVPGTPTILESHAMKKMVFLEH